nr:FABP family protein [Mycolicibacterium sphagni]
MVPELHPDVAVLAPLIGTWAGAGAGEYPTIASFGYREEIVIGHVGKPFLTYSQRTRATDDGRPLHAETGYLRVPAPGRIELVVAHPTGVTEIDEGTLVVDGDGLSIEVASTSIGLTGSAKSITALSRSFQLAGDQLTYRVAMAAVGEPLTHHLAATLRRQLE